MINFFTISAPSGSGKTTLCKAIQRARPEMKWSVSYTTRSKRVIEENGIDYHFISSDKFNSLIKNDHFVEWENVHGFYYGTSKETLTNTIQNEEKMLMEVDVNGSMKIKELYPKKTFSIFIMPPSIDHLRKRLESRGTDSRSRIEIRLKRFTKEVGFKEKFDHVIINEKLEKARLELINILDEKIKGVKNGIKNYTISRD
tara:strand:+ start:261 stop:860 length:600 start_codon:yes stop_codon:yes gene_type:complete